MLLCCLGLLVSFFSFFLIFLLLTIKNRYYICYIGLERVMGLAATKTGPNDAQSDFWAISEFFFFLSYFLITNYYNQVLCRSEERRVGKECLE